MFAFSYQPLSPSEMTAILAEVRGQTELSDDFHTLFEIGQAFLTAKDMPQVGGNCVILYRRLPTHSSHHRPFHTARRLGAILDQAWRFVAQGFPRGSPKMPRYLWEPILPLQDMATLSHFGALHF
jgi:hypothetical protein